MPPGRTRLPEGVTIRDFRPGDEPGLVAVLRDLHRHENQIYDRSRPADTMDGWYIDHLKQETARSQGRILVAEGPDGIVGYASFHAVVTTEDDKDEIPHSYSCVGDLGVLASRRSMGIGGALLDACEALAREAGQRWLRLSVLAGNDRARAFYQRHGLKEHLITLEKKL
ncbi:MAG: N-acetyltransferase family protein [Aestuariivirga sp.]|uniref:GNAT family N-acetyltransferase n=1 Tax=Aestuariivirga sp. TaxID=2650926 RepID=UPI0038D0959B